MYKVRIANYTNCFIIQSQAPRFKTWFWRHTIYGLNNSDKGTLAAAKVCWRGRHWVFERHKVLHKDRSSHFSTKFKKICIIATRRSAIFKARLVSVVVLDRFGKVLQRKQEDQCYTQTTLIADRGEGGTSWYDLGRPTQSENVAKRK